MRMRRRPLWRSPWVVGIALFCGFMFAAAGTAAVPSSALWTGRFVCSSPYHLVRQTSGNSYGNTSQSSVSFVCVDTSSAAKHPPTSHASTFKILGLQFALGTVVAYLVVLAIASATRRRRLRRPRSPGYA